MFQNLILQPFNIIWFLILASIHSTIIMYYFEPMDRLSSVMLNTYIYLPLSSLLSLPYIFYILLYSKTDNVIRKLYSLNIADIKRLKQKPIQLTMNDSRVVEHYQHQLIITNGSNWWPCYAWHISPIRSKITAHPQR